MKIYSALEIGDKNLNHRVKDIDAIFAPVQSMPYWEIRFTNGEIIITTLPIYFEYIEDKDDTTQ